MKSTPRPLILAILDGFGENANPKDNAVLLAKTPTLDALKQHYPHGLIDASELHVGLPSGQMGNSEVGHMNIGSGRVVMQDLPRIDQAIANGTFGQMPAFKNFVAALKKSGGACHLMGLLSPGGVHSHQNHMVALANLLEVNGIRLHVHAFLDGRDTPPKSALEYSADSPALPFATVSGRYYAMDRDKRWERVELAYQAIVNAKGEHAATIEEAIHASYAQGKTDEFLLPCILGNYMGIQPKDGILMANFRADRAREILQALVLPEFNGFKRNHTLPVAALGMVEYSAELAPYIPCIFPPEQLTRILGEVLAERGLKQLRIAETEKYAHVTFFFNGGREEPFAGEERILVPSPNVATYDLKPEMSAFELTDKLVAAIQSKKFDCIIVNYANCDMVGHTGNLAAAITAVEAVDTCLGKVWQAVEQQGGALVITADHGNAEQMSDEETQQAHTAHTVNRVPLILAVPEWKDVAIKLREDGRLADIAPTLLALLHQKQPSEMTGKRLFN